MPPNRLIPRLLAAGFFTNPVGICYACIQAEHEAMLAADRREAAQWARTLLREDLVNPNSGKGNSNLKRP